MKEYLVRNEFPEPLEHKDIIREPAIGSKASQPFALLPSENHLSPEQFTETGIKTVTHAENKREIEQALNALEYSFTAETPLSYGIKIGEIQFFGHGINSFKRFLNDYDSIVTTVEEAYDLTWPRHNSTVVATLPLSDRAFFWISMITPEEGIDKGSMEVGFSFNKQPLRLQEQLKEFYDESPFHMPQSFEECYFESIQVSGKWTTQPIQYQTDTQVTFAEVKNMVPHGEGIAKDVSLLDSLPLVVQEEDIGATELKLGFVSAVDIGISRNTGSILSTNAFR